MGCHSVCWHLWNIQEGNAQKNKYTRKFVIDKFTYFKKRFEAAETAYKNAKADNASQYLPKKVIKNADDWYNKVKGYYTHLQNSYNNAIDRYNKIAKLCHDNPHSGDGKCEGVRGQANEHWKKFYDYAKELDSGSLKGNEARHFYGNIQKLEGKANWLGKVVHWINRVSLNILIPTIGLGIKLNVMGLATKLDITRRKYPLNWNKVKSMLYKGFGVEYRELNHWIDIGKNRKAIVKPNDIKPAFKSLRGKQAFTGFAGSETSHKYKVLYNGYFNADSSSTPQFNEQDLKMVADGLKTLGDNAKNSSGGGSKSDWKPAAYAMIPTLTTAVGSAVGTPYGTVAGAGLGGALNLVVSAMPDKFKKDELANTPAEHVDKEIKNENTKNFTFIKNLPLWVKVAVPATVVVGSALVIFRKKIF